MTHAAVLASASSRTLRSYQLLYRCLLRSTPSAQQRPHMG